MKTKDKKLIIDFYTEYLWINGMPETLTDEQLNAIQNTISYAQYMLFYNYNYCVNSIKDAIKKCLHL